MYKCICLAVTEQEIQKLIESGLSREESYKKLQVGKECGICIKKEKKDEKSKAKNKKAT